MPLSSAVFAGVPSFFRACCHDATRGGKWSYEHPGREFGTALERLEPDHVEFDEWAGELDRVGELLFAYRFAEVERWLLLHYPRCMSLVPRRRRGNFMLGMREAVCD